MSGFWDNGPKSRHRYTVASAPAVIGSVFKRIFQLFLGQCTYCKFKKLGMCTSDGSALRLSLTAPCIDFIRVNVACPSVNYSSTLYTLSKKILKFGPTNLKLTFQNAPFCNIQA